MRIWPVIHRRFIASERGRRLASASWTKRIHDLWLLRQRLRHAYDHQNGSRPNENFRTYITVAYGDGNWRTFKTTAALAPFGALPLSQAIPILNYNNRPVITGDFSMGDGSVQHFNRKPIDLKHLGSNASTSQWAGNMTMFSMHIFYSLPKDGSNELTRYIFAGVPVTTAPVLPNGNR